jgi:transposase
MMKKRRWSGEEKRQIVEATRAAGASVTQVAQSHGVAANQVYAWRKQWGAGKLSVSGKDGSRLLPVTVAGGQGVLEIELRKGRLRITGADEALLRAALELLR